MLQDLGEPHHRELLGAVPGLAAGRDHARSCDPEAPHARHALRERFDEARAQGVSGGLPGDHSDPQRATVRRGFGGASG